jgi:hypothetical protein
MSWVGYLLKDSDLFILFAENSHILLKISVIPILVTFIKDIPPLYYLCCFTSFHYRLKSDKRRIRDSTWTQIRQENNERINLDSNQTREYEKFDLNSNQTRE